MNTQIDAMRGDRDPGGEASDAHESAAPADPADAADPLASETRNAAQTIAVWRSYLPEDCVATMIKMGWHRST
jgi:hypothetical protein